MLFWAFSIGDVFGCVLKIELRSTRIYMHKEEVSGRVNYMVGVRFWWTRGRLCCFLDDSSRDDLPFLSRDSGGSTSRGLSPLRSRLGWVWLNSHYHFLHWRWSLAKENIKGGWEKVEWLPVICHGFWTILLLQARWARLAKSLGEGLERIRARIQYLFLGDCMFRINLLQ